MNTYLNDESQKAIVIARFGAYVVAKKVTQGGGFYEGGGGGFVGCCAEARNYPLAAAELGWPEWFARLVDSIFDGLPTSETAPEAEQFGASLLEAIPVGVDLDAIRYAFLLAVQQRVETLLETCEETDAARVGEAVKQAIAYLSDPLGPDSVNASWVASLSAKTAEATARVHQGLSTQAAAWSAWSAATSGDSPWAVSESARSAARANKGASTTEFKAQRDSLIGLAGALVKT